MASQIAGKPPRRSRRAGRWTSFVAPAEPAGKPVRHLHEQGNPAHRLRVEHDAKTLPIHLSGADGDGWTTIVVDRATRDWAVAQVTRPTARLVKADEVGDDRLLVVLDTVGGEDAALASRLTVDSSPVDRATGRVHRVAC